MQIIDGHQVSKGFGQPACADDYLMIFLKRYVFHLHLLLFLHRIILCAVYVSKRYTTRVFTGCVSHSVCTQCTRCWQGCKYSTHQIRLWVFSHCENTHSLIWFVGQEERE